MCYLVFIDYRMCEEMDFCQRTVDNLVENPVINNQRIETNRGVKTLFKWYFNGVLTAKQLWGERRERSEMFPLVIH